MDGAGLIFLILSVPSSIKLLQRSGALIRSPSLLMAIASCILLGILGVNEIAFRGANSTLERSIEYQNENVAANNLVQNLLQAEAQLKGYIASDEASTKQLYFVARDQAQLQLGYLAALLQSDGSGLPEFSMLQQEVNDSLKEMQTLLDLYEAGEKDVLMIAMSNYRADKTIHNIQTVEQLYQTAQTAQIESTHKKTAFFLRLSQLGVALVSLAALIVFFLYLRKVKADREAQLVRQQWLEAEQARLESIVQQRTASLFALASHLQHVRDEERAALAQELHDELGSLLTVAKLDVGSLANTIEGLHDAGRGALEAKLAHLQDTLLQLFMIKRRIVDRLFPSALTSLGLNEALNLLVQQFSNSSGVQVDLHFDELALPEKTQLMVYRITQEALNNISKYAEATQVQLRLERCARTVRLLIEDNGKGFAADALPLSTYGIKGMKHRAETLGAKWQLDSGTRGTRIQVEIEELAQT